MLVILAALGGDLVGKCGRLTLGTPKHTLHTMDAKSKKGRRDRRSVRLSDRHFRLLRRIAEARRWTHKVALEQAIEREATEALSPSDATTARSAA